MPAPNETEDKVKVLVKDLLGENPITEGALTTLVSNLVNNDLTTVDFLAQAPVTLVDAVLNTYEGAAAKASACLRLDDTIEEAQARRSLKRRRAENEVEVFNMTAGLKNLQGHVGPLSLKAPPELIPQSRFLNKLKQDPYSYVLSSDLQVAQDVVDTSVTTKENLETGKPVHIKLSPSKPVTNLAQWVSCFSQFGMALMIVIFSVEEISPLAIIAYINLVIKLTVETSSNQAAAFDEQYRSRVSGYHSRGLSWSAILSDPGSVDSALLVSAQVGAIDRKRDIGSDGRRYRNRFDQVCRYWKLGRCNQGSRCRFRHSDSESSQQQRLPKSFYDIDLVKNNDIDLKFFPQSTAL
ncbi:hypothetical protein Pmar_PMAR029438 [Perkinsus marinus ATCC 50983]|uniref:C3H1-type domain-containing protein n=1 Tax=Perkinsus marinus (strain ATCC 50983 / TXsc) TaxID=423536 RepID=C5KGP0_PERM5|nr:hypothetical protein Pmar_PMAR029438 [Perkinsus marinus ATCC 50983]EER16308.1 hypothetical protein Pmar_PMAR029438 [Perkinsus marinus ATCC 50983]|eukprot:XP_002784512.1 hypothetical protein Pmar_PMAR029438 [Perkinsus marinus ATCC 50983]